MDIYTRKGDTGKTSLFDGIKISKSDIRVESYGTVDELVSFIGLSKNYFDDKDIVKELTYIQNKLFIVAANLATKDTEKMEHKILEEDVVWLENLIDKYMDKLEDSKGFIIPGTNKGAGYLQVSRSICRRAERRIISLSNIEEIDPILIKYLNRLSDGLYAIARYCEDHEVGVDFE